MAKSENLSPSSILVIRLSSLGDVILTTPLIRQLQRTYPKASIDVMVNERFSEVYAHNPRIRKVWHNMVTTTVDSGMDDIKMQMRASLDNNGYDVVIDLQNNLQSAAIRHGVGRRMFVYPKFRAEKLAMVWLKKFPRVTTPVVDRYRMPLHALPLVHDTEAPEVWLETEKKLGVYGKRFSTPVVHGMHNAAAPVPQTLHVALAPGAQHATKRWPAERFGMLARTLVEQGARVTLVGGTADVAICDAVATSAGVAVERADGATNLESTIQVLDSADVLVTNDSGVMHLGSARRMPIVAIFGSTVKQLGFEPYGVRHTVVEYDVSCRPCSHIGRSACPKKHFKCMTEIYPPTVLTAIHNLIERQHD